MTFSKLITLSDDGDYDANDDDGGGGGDDDGGGDQDYQKTFPWSEEQDI